MKNSFKNVSGYTTKKLTCDDARAFQEFCIRVYGSEDASRFLNGNDPEDTENWSEYLLAPDATVFALCHENKLVGTSEIIFRNYKATFTGSFIEPDYRGKGLSASLHDARKRYLDQINFTGVIETKILDTNAPSQRAAEKSGFNQVAAVVEDGVRYNVFHLER